MTSIVINLLQLACGLFMVVFATRNLIVWRKHQRHLEQARAALEVVGWLFEQDEWKDLLAGKGNTRLWGEWGDPVNIEDIVRLQIKELQALCPKSLTGWQSPHLVLPTESNDLPTTPATPNR